MEEAQRSGSRLEKDDTARVWDHAGDERIGALDTSHGDPILYRLLCASLAKSSNRRPEMTVTSSQIETDGDGASDRSGPGVTSVPARAASSMSRMSERQLHPTHHTRPSGPSASVDTVPPRLSAPTPLERIDATFEPTALRRLLGHFATGVTVVTCCSPSGADIGVTISALTSVSLTPPLLLVCVQLRTKVCECLATASEFGISVLASDQEAIARRFAEPCDDRFAGIALTRGKTGAALLHGALAHFECRNASSQHVGDHAIFIGEIIAGSARHGSPLLHFRGSLTPLTPVDRPVLGERLRESSD